jgi:hypothetical protein
MLFEDTAPAFFAERSKSSWSVKRINQTFAMKVKDHTKSERQELIRKKQ